MVKAHGSSGAEVFLIADYPSAEDVNNGKALSGSNEILLKTLFSEHHLNINDTWRTSLFKEKPDKHPKDMREAEKICEGMKEKYPEYNGQITNELSTIQPNIVVPLGEFAFRHFSGLKSIYKYRGSILELRPDLKPYIQNKSPKVISTFGPAIINTDWTSKAYVNIDIGKIAKYKNYYKEVKPDGILWIAKDAESFSNYLGRVKWTDNFVVFDIETDFGIPTCISFCFDENEAVCVPLLDTDIDMANRVILWQLVARVLNSSIEKVNQHIEYDVTILERFHFRVNGVSGRDTVLRAGLLYPELPKNLGFLTSIYTEMPYHKDEGKNEKDRNKLYLYCAKDSLATRRIFIAQEAEIKEFNLGGIDAKTQKLFHIYKKMNDTGIRVDDSARQDLLAKYTVMREVHQAVLESLYGRSLNVNSFPQVSEMMRELGFPKRASYDEDTIEELAGYPIDPPECSLIIKEVIYIRKIIKILEYLRVIIHPDDRWRAAYNLSGAETGRTTCNHSMDKMLWPLMNLVVKLVQSGRSLQTLSKHGFYLGKDLVANDLRKMFVPSPGKIFCEIDFNGAEARVDAVLAMEYDILPKFEDPGIHRLTGSWLFNCKPEDIKKGSIEYHQSKIFRHAGERNIGARRLAQETHRSIKDCEALLSQFHKYSGNRYRDVFHKDITDYVRIHRNLVTPHGRRRDFFARADNKMFNEAISYYPQAVVSDQNKFSFISVSEELNGRLDFNYLNEAHDSSLCELEKSGLELYATTAKKYMEAPIDFRNGSIKRDFQLSIPIEVEWSDTNWFEMKPFKI